MSREVLDGFPASPLPRASPLGRGVRARATPKAGQALPPPPPGLSAADEAAALAAFAAQERARATRRSRAAACVVCLLAGVALLAIFAAPRAPVVAVSRKSAVSPSTIVDVQSGNFALAARATINVDNAANFFAISFTRLSVSASAAGAARPFSVWRDDAATYTVAARSAASFAIVAAFDTASSASAITDSVAALACAQSFTYSLASLNVSGESAAVGGCVITLRASFTPRWMASTLPRASVAFDVPLSSGQA